MEEKQGQRCWVYIYKVLTCILPDLCPATPGLIIDAFGELRDQQEQVKEDMEVHQGKDDSAGLWGTRDVIWTLTLTSFIVLRPSASSAG